MRYEVTNVIFNEYQNEELEGLLSEGWEPFSATNRQCDYNDHNAGGYTDTKEIIWLRREVSNEVS